MPSSRNRKKNKGKERKAKQDEAKRALVYNTWKGLVRGDTKSGSIHCNHGLVEVPDITHPVASFLHTLFCRDHIMTDYIQQHTDVWNNECYRKMAVQMLVRIAATNLLANEIVTTAENVHLDGLGFAWGSTTTILVLENYEETFADTGDNYVLARHNRIVASKNRDVGFDSISRRDVIKFYRKRMNCKCLKKMHLEARKAQPKFGKCHHCKVEKERTLLMVCSRCMVAPYCSRKCQVAASPEHRVVCDKFVKAHERTMASKTT